MVQGGRPVLVAGAAGGSTIILGPLHAILDTVDFGMTLPQAVDAQRYDDQGSSKLTIEDARFDPAVLERLKAVGYTLDARGEYAVTPRMQLAGTAASGRRVSTAVSDSRSDRASLAVPVAPPPR
jgi:gamma-glutamyltranspeptidase/glutathione hydrolase